MDEEGGRGKSFEMGVEKMEPTAACTKKSSEFAF
jgi:hypothetical protein